MVDAEEVEVVADVDAVEEVVNDNVDGEFAVERASPLLPPQAPVSTSRATHATRLRMDIRLRLRMDIRLQCVAGADPASLMPAGSAPK